MNRKRTQRVYLDNRVYNYIIEKIINSKYKQGEMIRIDAIADELKISRTPVTQAIKTLASEDILTLTSTGKAYIPIFTPKQLVDIYQTRIAVEKYAVEALCCREDRTDIYRSLNHIQTVCRNCFERSAYLEYRKEDLLLHRTLVELTENEYLYGLFVKIQNMFMISNYLVGTHTLEQQQLSLEEHDQLIKAIYEGNKETAVCSIENHIIRALKQVLSKFALDVTEESMRALNPKGEEDNEI